MATTTLPDAPTVADHLRAQAKTLLALAEAEEKRAERERAAQAQDPALKIKEVAAALAISPQAVRALIKKGRLRALEHGEGHHTVLTSELAAYRRRVGTGGRP